MNNVFEKHLQTPVWKPSFYSPVFLLSFLRDVVVQNDEGVKVQAFPWEPLSSAWLFALKCWKEMSENWT